MTMYIENLNHAVLRQNLLTYELRIGPVEGNEEAEEVADWNNHVNELTYDQPLQNIEGCFGIWVCHNCHIHALKGETQL